MTAGSGTSRPASCATAGAGRRQHTAGLDTGKVAGRVAMKGADDDKALAEAIKACADAMKQMPGGLGGGDPMAKAMLEDATIKADGKDVLVSFEIPKKAITKAAKEFAKGIRRADEEL